MESTNLPGKSRSRVSVSYKETYLSNEKINEVVNFAMVRPEHGDTSVASLAPSIDFSYTKKFSEFTLQCDDTLL